MRNQKTIRARFAPSPTGHLHVGGARTALFNWLFARANKGRFILRVEDTDRARYSADAQRSIIEGLRWLGLDWDEGVDKGGEYGPYFQSERLGLYVKYAQMLLDRGNAYRCYCSPERLTALRAEQQKRKEGPRYDRKCRDLCREEQQSLEAQEIRPVVRLRVPLEGVTRFYDEIRGEIVYDNTVLDDLVLLKSDGHPTYHLANVVDDHLMEISHVLRGDEWISSTPRHVLLYQAFGWKPPKFAHLPVILSPQGGKLSKRHGSVAVEEYRKAGYLPEALVNFLALVGWSPGDDREKMSRTELIQAFSLEGITKRGAYFDEKKLEHLNSQYLQDARAETLYHDVCDAWVHAGFIDTGLKHTHRAWLLSVIALMKSRCRRLTDFVDSGGYFFRDATEYDPKGLKHWKPPGTPQRLRAVAKALSALESFDEASTEAALRALAEELGVSAAKLIHPIRLAITGRTVGPGLFELMAVLGKEKVARRIESAAALIESKTLQV